MTVTGIAFTECATLSGSFPRREVFPSADGVVEVKRSSNSTISTVNMFANARCGETRFSEHEFLNSNAAHADGIVAGRSTLQEIGGNPVLYATRKPSATTARIWKFNPVIGSMAVASSAFASSQSYDTAVRDYWNFGATIHARIGGDTDVRIFQRSGESALLSTSLYWGFTGGVRPENIDIEDDQVDGPWVWVSGEDNAGPFVQRLDDDEPTWSLETLPGYDHAYVDGIQCVGLGEAIGLSRNVAAAVDEDEVNLFRFTIGAAVGINITAGVTVGGQSYRDWVISTGDNIAIQSNVKMAVVGERVVALTNDRRVLVGTLIRNGGPTPSIGFVKKLTSSGITLFAGSATESGDVDGPALTTARFSNLTETVALSGGSQRNPVVPNTNRYYVMDDDKVKLIYPCSELINTTIVLVNYNVPGWKYQTGTTGFQPGFQNPNFNDSSWSTGSTIFGAACRPGRQTDWPTFDGSELILRRELGPVYGNIKIYIVIEDNVQVWFNGTSIYSESIATNRGYGAPFGVISVSKSLLDERNVLAIRAHDNGLGCNGFNAFVVLELG